MGAVRHVEGRAEDNEEVRVPPTLSRRGRRRPPVAVLALAALAVAFFVIPLVGLLQRAPWSELADDLTDPVVRDALRLSLVCSAGATALAFVLGLPLAWVLARTELPGRRAVRALVLLPMVLPPVVGGVALLLAFGRRGLVGQYLDDWFGVRLPFTTWGAILAEAFVAMPFFVIVVEAGLRSLDRRYEEAAATLGARGFTTFRRVVLPLIAPSLVAGAALTWARALGEFGATILFAGNLQGETQTMPLAIFVELQTNLGGAIALSLVLLAVSIVVLVSLRERWFPA
ncbi:MAG TPA: ABC transporter permease [Acidimicrobiia bacterium]|jgi:molybdate transport system permease protein|nr:ABC transporter permease [Acidimicrobiia bacterium]